MGIKPLNGAVSVLGCTSEHPPPSFSTQADIQRGEKENGWVQKRQEETCVVTCWNGQRELLLLLKWLAALIQLILKFTRCCLKMTFCHSTATVSDVPSANFTHLVLENLACASEHSHSFCLVFPSSGSCNHSVMFFLSNWSGSSGLWRHSEAAIKSFVPGTQQHVVLLAVKTQDSYSCQCLFLRWPPSEPVTVSKVEMESKQVSHIKSFTGYCKYIYF